MFDRILVWLNLFKRLSWRERGVCASAAVGLGGILSGLTIVLLSQSRAPEPVVQQMCRPDDRQVVVDIGGAIEQPGVYTVSPQARLSEVIDQAGGLSEQADLWHIAHDLNLAELITDGQKIYIPVKDELTTRSTIAVGETVVAGTDGTRSTDKVSLNSATQKELETLTGIGAVRATEIIAQRPYATVREVVEKGVLSATAFEKIEANLSL